MQTAFYFLALIWALSTAYGFVKFLHSEFEELSLLFAYGIAIPFWIFLGLGPFYLIKSESDYQKSETLATLKKQDWECSKTKQVVYTTFIQSGNTTVPITNVQNRCVQYSAKE
jgi:hypothetical protein